MSSSLKDPIGNMSKNTQFRVMFSAVAINILTFAFSCTLSYATPAVLNINDHRNPFHVNIVEQSWLISTTYVGNIIGSIGCGIIADALGRKLAMMFSGLFCIGGFILVAAAVNVQMLFAGIFIAATFGSINNAAVLLYCSEIAAVHNRGILVSVYTAAATFGTIFVLVVGSSLPFTWLAIVITCIYAVPIFVVIVLPESPRWFMLKGNRESAILSLKWFRGEDANIDKEMNVMSKSMIDAPKGMLAWKDLLKKWNAINLVIVSILLIVQAFSGNFVMLDVDVTVFQDSTVDINPEFQSDITVLFSILGSVLCLFVVDRWGRHELIFVSTLLTAVGMGMLAVFFRILELNPQSAISDLSWLPMFGLSISNFMFTVGLLPIPWIFACELFSTNVRGTAVTVAKVVAAAASFAAMVTFTTVQNAIDTSGAFTFYAAFGVVGIAFVVFAVKEPKKRILN